MRSQNFVLAAGIVVALACGGGGGGGLGTGNFALVPVVSSALTPTQIRFSPDGRLFYTELTTGKVRVVLNGTLLGNAFATLPVGTAGEQGLLGLAIDPDFANNHFVYVFHTHPNPLRQRVVRFTELNNVGTAETVIVDNIPAATNHDGGRIGFGPVDGKLYVTVGENGDPANSQNDGVLPGKLLRYNPDGSIPVDNPISGNPMFAKGLRNAFGLTFHPVSGRPYVSENGPDCDDEIDRIVPGGNYGWRVNYPCGDTDPNYIAPLARFTPTIAPTGVTFYTGSEIPELQGLFIIGSVHNDGVLRAYQIDDTNPGSATFVGNIVNRAGVLDVTTGPDGNLYVSDFSGIYRVIHG